ncbi:hypothetical protein, partial [Leptospira vanthielii]|uniref:hypothetical protein n=1 Tax=Leptospira vanthielii TaxID=293085 RepID=UPI001AEF54A7
NILIEIRNLFNSDGRQVPSHFKISYNCNKKNWKADFNYALNLNDSISVHELFDYWINEKTNNLSNK